MRVDAESFWNVTEQVNRIIFGKEREVQEILLAFLAGGHVLLEDIPGVGKTTMARAFAKVMGLDCRRVQFTPDVMPSDLTGFSIYRREEERFVYQPGSVFCNLLLADELNRATPRTQSALLEVMEERTVSVEGVTRKVPEPFLVLATQNPYGSVGTQPLPEAQVDRFVIALTLGYPDLEHEIAMAKAVTDEDRVGTLSPILSGEELLAAQRAIHTVYISDTVYRYLTELVAASRRHPDLRRGASPRATVSLVKMAKAKAWFGGRTFVTPQDVRSQYPYVMGHRIQPVSSGRGKVPPRDQILQELLDSVRQPPLGVAEP